MKKKIIIADDDYHILQLLSFILNDYEIYTAQNGEEVFQLLEKVSPDLILLDVMMPKINGYQTCQLLKADEKTKHIRVAIISAKSEKKDFVEGIKCGADFYFSKPFDTRLIQSKVSEILAF